MKIYLQIAVLIIASSMTRCCFAQTPSWFWASGAGSVKDDECRSTCVDPFGNVIVAGWFKSPLINFGSNTLTNTDASGNTNDIFLVKYSSGGNVIWAKSAGGTSFDEANGVCTDVSGNIFITGNFYSPVLTAGTQSITNTDPSPTGNTRDIFTIKFSPLGDVLWAKGSGGTGHDNGFGCATDFNNNLLITGSFSSASAVFDTISLANSTSTNFDDIFLVKYSPTGDVLWASGTGGSLFDYGRAVSTDQTGNIVITGDFSSGTVPFGPTTISNFSGNANECDLFVAKYDPSGNVLWAKGGGAGGYDYGKGIATDQNENVVVTGYYQSYRLSFDNDTIFNSNSSYNDIFVAKFSPAGNLIWLKSAGGSDGNDNSYAVTSDLYSNIIIAGSFGSSACAFGNINMNLVGGQDLFVTKYNSSGNELWATAVGGSDWESGHAIASDPAGTLAISGIFYSSSLIFGSSTLSNSGNSDMFVAKLDNATGIFELQPTANTTSVFPNPFISETRIITSEPINNGTLSIYNNFGQVVKEMHHLSGNTIELQRGNLSDGLYFFIFKNEQKQYSGRFMIVD